MLTADSPVCGMLSFAAAGRVTVGFAAAIDAEWIGAPSTIGTYVATAAMSTTAAMPKPMSLRRRERRRAAASSGEP